MSRSIQSGGSSTSGRAPFLRWAFAASAALILAGCADLPTSQGSFGGLDPAAQRAQAPVILRLATLPAEGAQNCNITVSAIWTEGQTDDEEYEIEGLSEGPVCDQTALTLNIRAPSGRLLWRETLSRDEVFGFDQTASVTQMRGRMIDWITNFGSLNRSSRQLPPWPEGARLPEVGEGNAFFPAQNVSRAEYETIRTSRAPLYCYAASLTHWNCVTLNRERGRLTYVGAQTFDG